MQYDEYESTTKREVMQKYKENPEISCCCHHIQSKLPIISMHIESIDISIEPIDEVKEE